MRLVCAVVLAASLSLLALAFGGNPASAGIVCGNFDGKFTCRSDSNASQQFGKNATPGAPTNQEPSPEPPAGEAIFPVGGGGWSTEQGTAAGAPDGGACQHGMVGTPPNCHCPKSSELLGGNCVHYTASACSNGLASNALPQACRGVEEKVSCSMRQDGLKDCCCVTYDKF